jgi:hypothetical protein
MTRWQDQVSAVELQCELIEARTRIAAWAEAMGVLTSARDANLGVEEWTEQKARADRKNRVPTPRPVVSEGPSAT